MPWGSMWMVMPWRWLSRKSSSRRNLVAHICRQSRQYTDTSSSRDCTRNKQHDADGQQHLVNEYLGVLHPVNRYQEHLVNKYLGALCPVNHDQQHHTLQQWWPYTTAMMAIHYSNDETLQAKSITPHSAKHKGQHASHSQSLHCGKTQVEWQNPLVIVKYYTYGPNTSKTDKHYTYGKHNQNG